MPTERFYHLPEEKKRIIREAAMEEFIRMPFDKASINQIILKAGISRGSFYTYFEDKRDLLSYIIGDMIGQIRQIWDYCLMETEGDLWSSSAQILDYIIEFAGDGKMSQMMQNIVVYQDFEKIFAQLKEPKSMGKDLIRTIQKRVNTSRFHKSEPDDIRRVLAMLNLNMMECLGQYYCHPENLEKIKKEFRERLEILQHGVCKS